MARSSRLVARVGAVAAVAVLAVLHASPASAGVPLGWPEPEPMSVLHAIGLFVGVPVALSVAIALFTIAPSLRQGSGHRPGLPWYAEPEQFGTLPVATTAEATAVEAGSGSQLEPAGGGAHGSW